VKSKSLRDVYVEELQDLYDAENQIIKALPKMVQAASSDELREAFEEHLEQTRTHAQRLEQIFEAMGQKTKSRKCKGMEGVIKEGSEIVKEDLDDAVMDAALISAAQRVEHYEMAGYGTVRTWATLLQEEEAVSLLEQTLSEEKETDQKLTELAENINLEAEEGSEDLGAEDEEGEMSQPAKRQTKSGSRRKSAA